VAAHQLVLDFRAVDKELNFTFARNSDGSWSVSVSRTTGLELPMYNHQYLDLPFSTIKFTHIDENTIIYAGRNENTFTMDATVQTSGGEFPGRLIGGEGRRPIEVNVGSVLRTIDTALGFGLPGLGVSNTIDISSVSASGWTHCDAGSSLKSLFSAASLGSFFGKTQPHVPGLLPGRFENIENIHYGAGFNLLIGSGIMPSTGDGATAGDHAKDFLMGLPDASFGANTFSVGSGILGTAWKMIRSGNIGSLLAGMGVHLLAGMSGGDTYKFDGLWGAAGVVELPDLNIGGVAAPEFFDTLDFSAIKGDLDITVVQGSADFTDLVELMAGKMGADWPHSLGVGSNFVMVTAHNALLDSLVPDTSWLPFAEGGYS